MPYNLKSIVTIPKYKGLTVQECIDQHWYAWKNIINKHPEYYYSDVHNYIKEISLSLHSNNLNKYHKAWMNRENT